MRDFGIPPRFPVEEDESSTVEEPKEVQMKEAKAKGKKVEMLFAPFFYALFLLQSKAVAKTGGGKYQWEIMHSLGISESEIPKFADASYWLKYFPPRCIEDVKAMGGKVRLCFVVSWRLELTTAAGRLATQFLHDRC